MRGIQPVEMQRARFKVLERVAVWLRALRLCGLRYAAAQCRPSPTRLRHKASPCLISDFCKTLNRTLDGTEWAKIHLAPERLERRRRTAVVKLATP